MENDRFKHYRTGIERIDTTHLEILGSLEEIDRLMKEEKYVEVIPLIEIINNTLFLELPGEDAEMIENSYPYAAPHISAHKALLLDFISVLDSLAESIVSPKVSIYQIRGRAELFYQHIDNYDLPYSDWLKKNNLD